MIFRSFDAALRVDEREVRLGALGDDAVGRRGPAERIGAAELDLRVGDARVGRAPSAAATATALLVTTAHHRRQRASTVASTSHRNLFDLIVDPPLG